MKCYKCNKGPQHGKTVFAIDPPGLSNRRWVCRTCASDEDIKRIPDGVIDTTNDIEDVIRNA